MDDLWWAGTDHQATLQRLAQRASRSLEVSSAVFILESGTLVPRAFWDDDPQRRATIRALFDRGSAPAEGSQLADVLRDRRPLLVSPAVESVKPSFYGGYITDAALRSYLILPLVAHDEALGLLAVGRHGDQPPFDEAAQRAAERIAAMVAHIVRLAGLVDHLRMADAAMGAMLDAVVATDVHRRITFWNRGAEQLYQHPAAEVLGRPIESVLQPDRDIAERQRTVASALDQADRWTGRAVQLRADGSQVAVDCVVTRLQDEHGELVGGVMVNRDVTREVAFSAQLAQQQALAQAALDSSPLLTAVVDTDGVVLAASRGWAQHIGPAQPIGSTVADAAARLLPEPRALVRLLESLEQVVTDRAPQAQSDYDVTTENGDATFSVHIARIPDVGAAITIADITDRVSRERALTYTAGHDSVTRLPNRTVFMDRAAHALNRAARKQSRVGLLFCDLDSFKDLNDRYGHGVGDDVLEEFGHRLVQSCRASDTVARLGGDEFVVLLEDGVDDGVVGQVAQRVVHSAAAPLRIPAGTLTVTTSVGAVVVEPEPSATSGEGDVAAMLACADAAMYEAKRRGKNRWVMDEDASIRAQWDSRDIFLGNGPQESADGKFQLHFQPRFDSAGTLRGAETLLRRDHPERGLFEPFDVMRHDGSLPMAAGDWVLGNVAASLRAWIPHLPDGFRMGVNLSPGQWLDRAATDSLLTGADRVGVPLSLLRLEVPQEALMVDLEHSHAAIRSLTEAGVDVAVNGFGAGGAPLTDLAALPVGTAVLGRSVVRDIGRTEGADRLLRGVVRLCDQLGWQVIVTGIETRVQLDSARGAGCSLVQGYLLGRPVPADEFAAVHLPDLADG